MATALAGLCLIAGIYLAVHKGDASHLRTANALAEAGRYDAALAEAERVSRRPAETRARLLEAYARLAQGRLRPALAAFARVADRDPDNWVVRRDWAVALRQAGRQREARRQIARALTLNPRMVLPRGFRYPGPADG